MCLRVVYWFFSYLFDRKNAADSCAAVGMWTHMNLWYDATFSSKKALQSQIQMFIKENNATDILVG